MLTFLFLASGATKYETPAVGLKYIDHMVGNVYCKFADEEHSDAALKALFGRFYAGRPRVCEFSPVTDFREARCRQYDEAVCTRGGYCNFIHPKHISLELRRRY